MNKIVEDLVREERLKYYSEWRKNNRDKIKKYNKKFWLKKIMEREKSNE